MEAAAEDPVGRGVEGDREVEEPVEGVGPTGRREVQPLFFFCLFITRVRPMEIMARIYTVRFLSAVRAVTARCKQPFCPPPRPVPRKRVDAPKENDQGKNQRKSAPRPPLLLACRRHEVGRG